MPEVRMLEMFDFTIHISSRLLAHVYIMQKLMLHVHLTMTALSGVARILVRGRHAPGNFLKFESLKWHFLHFEGTFEQNI